MVKRPGPLTPSEAGLRELVAKTPRPRGKLETAMTRPVTLDERALRDLVERVSADMPPEWSPSERAAALWSVVLDEVDRLEHIGQKQAWRVCLRAALAVPAESYARGEDGLHKRLESVRSECGLAPSTDSSDQAMRRLWTYAIYQLGLNLEAQLAALSQNPSGWAAVAPGLLEPAVDEHPVPPGALPVRLDRVIATYRMLGRSVHEALTERWITPLEPGVDEYVVRAYSPNSLADQVKVEALLNCRRGDAGSRTDGRGGVIHEVPIRFPAALPTGRQYFFATRVTSQQNEQPIVEYEVTGSGIAAGGLTMRIQFAEGYHPRAAWWFAETLDAMRLITPSVGDERRLWWNEHGYMEYTFPLAGKVFNKYGIAWDWGGPNDEAP